MHSNKNVRIFRLSRRSEERHPKCNGLLHECPISDFVKNWPVVFVGCSSFPIAYVCLIYDNTLKERDRRNGNLQDGYDRQKLVHVWYQISLFFDLVPLRHIYHEKIYGFNYRCANFYRNSFWRQNSFHYLRKVPWTSGDQPAIWWKYEEMGATGKAASYRIKPIQTVINVLKFN